MSSNFVYLSFKDFEKRWHDIDNRTGHKYFNFGLSVYGARPDYKSKKMMME